MANTLKEHESNVICGLGSFTFTIPSTKAGLYTVSVFCTEVPTSQISITLSQSGSKSVSVVSTAPSSSQNQIQFQQLFNVAVADVLTVAISTSDTNLSDPDNQKNTVKSIVVVKQGQ